ncbi:hypothetical protein [Bradyrhizobium oropedii]|uniref:hypothetical protein n=1 Tax=Bradyrhizobium oropedii TaxID=1571201 RepID=UPI001E3FB3E1|nr:hypothetical protein [Bradyrhizobium oropedii]
MLEIAEVDNQRRAGQRDCENDDREAEALVVEQPIGQCREGKYHRDFRRRQVAVD